jgi:glycine/D-amino acid oxidase-like deaminating enzyme
VESWLKRIAPHAKVTERWSGQVLETPDFLPIIGTVAEGQFVATGFAGNGMTFGTLAAMMARDLITGVANPWRHLFDADRSIVARASAHTSDAESIGTTLTTRGNVRAMDRAFSRPAR